MAATQTQLPSDHFDFSFPPPPSSIDEQDAIRINNAIDEEIKRDQEARNRRKHREIKVMLLGQAESGKSTLQKQFQLHYASQTLDPERPSWRPVVYFNILKAIGMILDEVDSQYFTSAETSSDAGPSAANASSSSASASSSNLPSTANSTVADPVWYAELAYLRGKLLPLVASEDALAAELSGGITVAGGRTGVFVRAGWQVVDTNERPMPLSDIRNAPQSRSYVMTNIVGKTLAASQNEIGQLWRHPAVTKLLKEHKLRLEEYAAFFLDSIHRIAEPDYLPTTEDILHVRVQTLGVKEHAFNINMGVAQYNCILYDVGGARGQRQAWVPFFEDATAIIFLAPISAFDQYLEEEPRTNRIDDSLQLFTAICSNKLLHKATLVLMLNKTDLLKEKLADGIKVRKYISSYGDRPNTFEEVSEYFRAHFIQVHRRKDTNNRPLYLHFTSMLDMKAMQGIIVNVGESILRAHMATVGLA